MIYWVYMKIFYDARWILIEDRFDGISRYSHELAWALSRQEDINITWIVYDEKQLEKLPKAKHIIVNNPENAIAELSLPKKLNEAGAEIVYSPFFVMGTLGKKYKLVLTIHDLIYFKHRTPPQWLPWYTRLGWRIFHLTYLPMRWQLNRADHIATVSETAKNELVRARATKRAITAVKNSASDSFTLPASTHHDKNHVTYMGSFTPYKNVECVIDAVSLVPEAVLNLCGKIPEARRESLESYLKEKGVFDRTILHNGVSDKEYLAILKESRCAISASKIEGFGLPLIEAQQAGVPFVAADTPIFREVGGDSMLYFNTNDPVAAANHIKSLSDAKTSEKYQKFGFKNTKRFSWDKSAKKALEICESL